MFSYEILKVTFNKAYKMMGRVGFFWTGIIFQTANKNGYKCTSVSIFVTYFNKYPYPKYFGSENTEIYAPVDLSIDWFD